VRVGDDQIVVDFRDLAIEVHIACYRVVVDVAAKAFGNFRGLLDEFVSVIARSFFEEANIFVAVLRNYSRTTRLP